mmetsp:Transcript_34866/g.63491  ORF Transcript_34866/g.63491 Transcript_34866/m.63491 type:complete len:579 (-) Transcript_34866:39-1775(-)
MAPAAMAGTRLPQRPAKPGSLTGSINTITNGGSIGPLRTQEVALRYGTTLPLQRSVPRPSSAALAARVVRRNVERASSATELGASNTGGKGLTSTIAAVAAAAPGLEYLEHAAEAADPWPGLNGARARPQSAAAGRSASRDFAAALASGALHRQPEHGQPEAFPGIKTIGSIVGRGRPAPAEAQTQLEIFGSCGGSHGSRPANALRRALSAGALGRQFHPQLRPNTMLYRVASASPSPIRQASYAGRSASPARNLSASFLFDEIIRRDRTYGQLLLEIKAGYETFMADRGVNCPPNTLINLEEVSESHVVPEVTARSTEAQTETGAAEVAVEAVRRPWIEEAEGSATDRAGGNSTSRRRAPAKVRKLEKENAALRELVRRFRGELNGEIMMPPLALSSIASIKDEKPEAQAHESASEASTDRTQDNADIEPSGIQAEAVRAVNAALSAWSSKEPLAFAALGRGPSERPSHVPALDFSALMELLEYDEEEEEEEEEDDDEYEDEVEAGLRMGLGIPAAPGAPMLRPSRREDSSSAEEPDQVLPLKRHMRKSKTVSAEDGLAFLQDSSSVEEPDDVDTAR